MINLVLGTIKTTNGLISINSNETILDEIAKDGLIEKRKIGRGIVYYYLESTAVDKRFGAFITLRARQIDWIRLDWLDTPMKGWDEASEKGVKDEFHMLTKLVKKILGRNPDDKKPTMHIWHLEWGKLQVSCDLRSLQADIYMMPK